MKEISLQELLHKIQTRLNSENEENNEKNVTTDN
jgi:hypothetical protein